MFGRISVVLVATVGLGLALVDAPAARTAPPSGTEIPAGLEILGRGPVHEAYAQPLDSSPQPGPVIQRDPPTTVEELPPDQKPDGSVWIPGYWQWDDTRSDFIWVSGFWRVPPPGRTWVPGNYQKTADGYQWVPGVWMAQGQSQLNVVPTPPASVETGPSLPAPTDNSLYIPGVWLYQETRFVWQPGYWTPYRPDLVWCPARYEWTPSGYVFVDGYWDYPLARRGLLFAPVCFTAPLYARPGFLYTPSFVVNADFLPTALFVRPGWGHYYFGDYFGTASIRAGFSPWVTYRVRGSSDPLFAYSRVGYGPAWATGLRGLYADRLAGTVVLPPRTLGQQQALVRNITVNKTVGVANVGSVTPLAPLSQAQGPGLRLQAVTQAQRVQFQQSAQQARVLSQQRTLRIAPTRSSDPPQQPRSSGSSQLRTPSTVPSGNPSIRTTPVMPLPAPKFTTPPVNVAPPSHAAPDRTPAPPRTSSPSTHTPPGHSTSTTRGSSIQATHHTASASSSRGASNARSSRSRH